MDEADIGRALLPLFSQNVPSFGTNLRDFVRGLAERYPPPQRNLAARLLSEGAGFLARVGYVVDNPLQLGSSFVFLSRAGERAITSGDVPTATVLEGAAERLLHPRIADVALPEMTRRPPRYDSAVFEAFRAVEIDVRALSGTGANVHGQDVFVAAFGAGRGGARGALTPEPMHPAEASGYQHLFAGAYAVFRNPPAHRDIEHDPDQAMRLLILASALVYEAERLANERGTPPN